MTIRDGRRGRHPALSVRAALAACLLGATAAALPALAQGAGAGAAPHASAATCTFNGKPGIATLTGITPGSTVAISCTAAAGQTFYAAQASLLGDIAVSPASDTNEADLGTLTTLTGNGTSYTASFKVPTTFKASDKNATCPVQAGQFNAGIVGCVIAVVTGSLAVIPNADAILYYSTQTHAPDAPEVALPPGTVSQGQHITFNGGGACPVNPTPSSHCWWGQAFGTSSTAAKTVTVTLDGKPVAGATATIAGPGKSGAETWNGSKLIPSTLSGSLTLPATLSLGHHTLTVTEHNTTKFSGNGPSPAPGSVLTASVVIYVVQAQGYWLACADGAVFPAGTAPAYGGTSVPSTDPVVGMATGPGGKGYWLVTRNGTVFAAGDAKSFGDLPAMGVKVSNIVGIASTGDGGGYWMIGSDGGEFAFGNAKYHGSLPGLGIHVNDIVGMVATSNGGGYWVVGADGGVFAFGNTHYVGSLPGLGVHVHDITAMIPSPTRGGYDLVGKDGGVFVFGNGVHYYGSLPGKGIKVDNIVGLSLTPPDGGYWFAGSDANVYPFGDAQNIHPSSSISSNLPVAAIATS
jgi:hypothetical protein